MHALDHVLTSHVIPQLLVKDHSGLPIDKALYDKLERLVSVLEEES